MFPFPSLDYLATTVATGLCVSSLEAQRFSKKQGNILVCCPVYLCISGISLRSQGDDGWTGVDSSSRWIYCQTADDDTNTKNQE